MITNFYLSITDGSFDEALVRSRLDAMPDAVEDPRQPNRYFLCGLSTLADSAYVEMTRGTLSAPSACAVLVGPHDVFIQNELGHWEDARSSVPLVEWLWSTYPCRLRHEYGHDLTDEFLRQGLPFIFDGVLDLPLAWTQSLVPLGRFRELDRYDSHTGPSLEVARRRAPVANEDEILSYLQSGVLLERVDAETFDVYDEDLALGPLEYFTDGMYIWPSDLPHYVRTYHARLPRAFVMHARNAGWRVPSVDLESLPPTPP